MFLNVFDFPSKCKAIVLCLSLKVYVSESRKFPSKYKAIVLCFAIKFHVSESLKFSFNMQGYSRMFCNKSSCF